MSSDREQRKEDPSAHEQMMDSEKHVQRNPHQDFRKVQDSRPDWSEQKKWAFTKTRNPDWKLGDGPNDGGECLTKEHVEIDPHSAPNWISQKFFGTGDKRLKLRSIGKSTNLAPFSYFGLINHDPPIFTIGYAGGFDHAKDSLTNLSETGECCLNIVSEHFIEAANATSINAPYGISEWALTGLHPAPCKDVKASRVKEAVFSIEGKLMSTQEFESRATPGKKTGVLAIIEGVRFWAREDAINNDRNLIDPAILRPVSRLGGITYGRLLEGVEIPRPEWDQATAPEEAKKLIKPKTDGQ
ncbi:hypothetical protein LTR04_002918 [Oleoguttula sp. CCFEE 6159]|nr:hypothetical protein LTR04_002918 [Oleoguttula sp. CCFEE 6159]